MSNQAKTVAVLGFILILGLADAIFKVIALDRFGDSETLGLSPIVTFSLHKNPGIAFDIPLPLFVVVPLSLVASAIFARVAYKEWSSNRPLALSAVSIVVGTLGNMVDRLVNNFTTDYLILFKTSAINFSDVLILLGIVGALWYSKNLPVTPFPNGATK